MIEKKESIFKFECPECRGSYFGVSSDNTICCHDEKEYGCKWRSEMKYKWKFFIYLDTTKTIYESIEEFNLNCDIV